MEGNRVLHENVPVALFASEGTPNDHWSGRLRLPGKHFLDPTTQYRLVLSDGRSGRIRINSVTRGSDTPFGFVGSVTADPPGDEGGWGVGTIE